jgi:hypothetical protein
MPTPGQELASLDFAAMIGGPLNAVVQAQAQSAMTSVDFIKTVGFTEDGEVINVDFKYTKTVENPDGTTGEKKMSLAVPILTILPIPFLRIEEATVGFNAKITSTVHSTTTTDTAFSTELKAKASYAFFSASLKANFSYKKKTTSGSEVNRTYSMSVNVKALQDELPAGMERILGILENSIEEKPE